MFFLQLQTSDVEKICLFQDGIHLDFTALCITMQLPHSATLVAKNFTDCHGIYSLEWICDGSTINLLDS